VQYVSFALSDAKRAEVRKQALTEASKNAREQADAIAKGLNVRITGIERVSVGYDYQPYPYVYGKALAAGASESAPTQVDPANVEVSATVQVTFSFE
jgi:uncharacterized protein YggE